MKGYQADIEGQDRWTGQVYEERGRTFLALRGQVTHATEGGKREIIASLGDAKELQAWVKKEYWNQYHLIIRGNVLIHILNGQT